MSRITLVYFVFSSQLCRSVSNITVTYSIMFKNSSFKK